MKYTKEEVIGLFEKHYKEQDYCFHNLNPFLKEEGLLKEDFEVGKWYKWDKTEKTDVLFYATELTDYPAIYGYGFSGKGVWSDETFFYRNPNNYNDALAHLIPATDQEVEEALRKEAKKKGYKLGNFKCLQGWSEDKHFKWVGNSGVEYEYYNCELWTKGGLSTYDLCIFKDGKWAEIVEEKKPCGCPDYTKLKGGIIYCSECNQKGEWFVDYTDLKVKFKKEEECICSRKKKEIKFGSGYYSCPNCKTFTVYRFEKSKEETISDNKPLKEASEAWSTFKESLDKMTYVSESKPNVSTSWCWYKQAGEVIKNSVQVIKDYEKLSKVLDGTEERMKAIQKAARGLNQTKYPSGGLTDKDSLDKIAKDGGELMDRFCSFIKSLEKEAFKK